VRAFRLAVGGLLAAALFAALSVGSAGASVSPAYSATDVTTCNGTSTVTVRIDAQNPPPTLQAADIVLLVDDSGSIGTAVFNGTVRPTLDSFIASALPSATGNHIGIIEFSTTARNQTTGLLSDTTSLQHVIDTMVYSAGNTFTLTGLQAANAMLSGVGSRPTAPKVIIVETDGVWTVGVSPPQDPTAYAAGLRAAGTDIFAVGVGSGVNPAQLQAIAGGDATHVFSASNYSQLEAALNDALLDVVPAATNLSYTEVAAPGWTITGATATAGTALFSPTGVSWSLASINSATPTSVTITYTEQHTASTGGPAIPLNTTAHLNYIEGGVSRAVDFGSRPIPVSGCNRPPVANAGPDQTVSLSGSPVAHVQLDGSASSDPDSDPLTYSWTVDGALGPIDAVAQPTVDLGIGTHAAHLTVSDGFFTSTADVTITVVDPSPPVVTANVAGPQHNSWYTANAVVSFTVVDPESDITSQSADCAGATVSTDTAGQTFTCTATSAGGTSAPVSAFVKRDATGPSVVFGGNAGTYSLTDTVAITCTASDALSGLDGPANCGGVSGVAWSLGAGLHTVTRTATDIAGNSTTQTTTYTVAIDVAGICALIEQWSDNAGVAHSLCGKLDKGNMRPFWNELAAQRGKHLPADKADIILALSRGL
jgi:hypothetical protein